MRQASDVHRWDSAARGCYESVPKPGPGPFSSSSMKTSTLQHPHRDNSDEDNGGPSGRSCARQGSGRAHRRCPDQHCDQLSGQQEIPISIRASGIGTRFALRPASPSSRLALSDSDVPSCSVRCRTRPGPQPSWGSPQLPSHARWQLAVWAAVSPRRCLQGTRPIPSALLRGFPGLAPASRCACGCDRAEARRPAREGSSRWV